MDSLSAPLFRPSDHIADQSIEGNNILKFSDDQGLYSDNKKPSGTLGYIASFQARFANDSEKQAIKSAYHIITARINEQHGPEAATAFYNQFANQRREGKPLTLDQVEIFLKDNISQTASPAIADPGRLVSDSQEITAAFNKTEASPEKTMTLTSRAMNSLSGMGFFTSSDPDTPNAKDASIPIGGAVKIYGQQERAAMITILKSGSNFTQETASTAKEFINAKLTIAKQQVSNRENRLLKSSSPAEVDTDPELQRLKNVEKTLLEETKGYENWEPDRLLAYNKAGSVDWDRLHLQVGTTTLKFSKNDNPGVNLNKFKTAIQATTTTTISDRQAYEMMRLIDKDSSTGGFPSGQDISTGMAFNAASQMLDAQGEPLSPNKIHITLTKDGSFHFDYTSARAHLHSIAIPKTDPPGDVVILSAMPDSEGGSRNIDREGRDKDIPQFETSTKYTYAYTPPDGKNKQGDVSLLDSRQAYWRIN